MNIECPHNKDGNICITCLVRATRDIVRKHCPACGVVVDCTIDQLCADCARAEIEHQAQLIFAVRQETELDRLLAKGNKRIMDRLFGLPAAAIVDEHEPVANSPCPQCLLPSDVDGICARCRMKRHTENITVTIEPPCYNREPFTDPNAGWYDTGKSYIPFLGPLKPILRYRWPWFTDRCATHDGVSIGPNGENYPAAHNWNCEGCKWKP